MFDRWRLERRKERVFKRLSATEKLMKAKGCKQQDIENEQTEDVDELFQLSEDIRILISRKWEARATRHFLPVPPRGKEPYWDTTRYRYGHVLTDEGIDRKSVV